MVYAEALDTVGHAIEFVAAEDGSYAAVLLNDNSNAVNVAVEIRLSPPMPFHMVGSHRRIYLRDLLDYKRRRDVARHEAINNMARAEMEAGTYDKVVLPEGAEDE